MISCVVILVLFSTFIQSCSSYEQCFAKPLQKNPDAEARFSVILSLRQTSGDEECQDIATSAIMTVAAIDWAVSRLNNVTLVPGVNFGYDLYDDCGIERYSMYSVLDAMDYYFPPDLRSCTGNSSTYYLGILGPSRSQNTQKVLEMVENMDIPVVSPTSTSPDLRNSPNFFRTVPSDDDQVRVFVDLMEQHNWNYVVAMHTDDNYGRYGVTKIAHLAKIRNICVNVIPGFKTTETFDDTSFRDTILQKLLDHIENTTDETLGVLYFGQRNVIQQLLSKMQLTANIKAKLKNIKWIMSESIGTRVSVLSGAPDVTNEAMTISMTTLDIPEVLEHANKIRSSASTSDDISSLIKNFGPISGDDWKDYIVSILDSVFAVTTSLKTAFDTRCTGYKVICEGFEDYYNSKKLETMNNTKVNYTALGPDISPTEFINKRRVVTFNGFGDLVPDSNTPLYDINMFTKPQLLRVGSYVNSSLSINLEFPSGFPSSKCQKGCELCVETPNIAYEFIEGDVYILGFFSLHRLSDDPFGCGEFRNLTFDVLSVEAFLNSIKESQSETNIKFGGIAFDDCYSSSRASMIISDLYTGKLKIPSETNPIDPAKIVGVVGPFPSGVTVPVTFLFSSIALPSISYASTSPDLDDKEINFPYFFRTVPSDVDQAHAMVEVLNAMGWQSVGLVYVNSNYGSKGKDAFKRVANASGICIVGEIKVQQEDSAQWNFDAQKSLESIMDKGTNLFIYFGTEGRMVDILSHIKDSDTPEANKNKFIFIGSDDWADSRNIKNMFGEMIEGSISFKIKTRTTNTNFVENLIKKTSSLDTASYWYKKFFRNYFQCYFEDDFVKAFPKPCSDNITITDTNGIMADGRVSHCILAVKALTKGIAKAKTDLCQGETEFPCAKYKRNVDHVRNKIAEVNILDDNQISFNVFDKNRNGDVGFQILQIRKDGDDFVYAEVGSYDNDNLMIKSENVRTAIANTLSVAECEANHGLAISDLSSSSPEQEDFRLADIIVIALLGSLCVVLIIVIFAVVYCFWRKTTGLHKMLEETKARITYYNEIGTPKKQKQKHSGKKNGDIGSFDNPVFPNGGLVPVEPPGQHYLPLHESGQVRSAHRYDGNRLDLLNQTTPKQSVSTSNQSLLETTRPDLPPRNIPEQRIVSKSESDIHNSYPVIKPKMGNYFALSNQPRMGTAMNTTPTDSLHSQGSVFGFPRQQVTTTPDEENPENILLQTENHIPPSKSLPSSPRSPYEKHKISQTVQENRTRSQSSPLSHNNSIHSQFSGETLHMTGNLSPQRRKRLKSFSSEEPQKISRV
ncbi:GRM5 [Mytilus coruscus]|uniref:GRM5 n=1 Tax=Mytilus coruscus TaxID=42192 RepID=A0A6J8DEU1_MYTCO|nr:GRM5 [Mytilus coruscus]